MTGAARTTRAAVRRLIGLGVVVTMSAALAPVAITTGAAAASADDHSGQVADPIVTPATGGHGEAAGGLRYDVSQFGYEEREYLFEGTARAFGPDALPDAPYRSRMIVYTPRDPRRFDGTTVVEWAEVSDFGRFDLMVELNAQAPFLEAEGYAFVLVSAEPRGICDLVDGACVSSSLRAADTERYGTLVHPGDAYSFDIFSQAMQAVKHPTDVAPLGRLKTRVLVAEGFQRSIDKYFPVGAPVPDPGAPPPVFSIYGPLNDYLAHGADDAARVADAFLIDGAAPAIEPARYRVPTLHHLDESAIRRTPTPDRRNHVTWEVTGAPHADRWAGSHTRIPSPDPPPPKLTRAEEEARRGLEANVGLEPLIGGDVCAPGPRTGSPFPRRFTLDAALAALERWAVDRVRAPSAPRIQRVGPTPTSAMAKLERDADGNAIGGLRSPVVAVPVGAYNGEACISSGTYIPYSDERLAQRYASHADFVRAMKASVDAAVGDRTLVCRDAAIVMRQSSASAVGGPDPFTARPRCASGRPPPN